MNEAEWLSATDPMPMLEFLRGRVCERKARLISCGCVRSVDGMPWEVLEAVKYVEQYCDGLLAWPEVVTRLNRKAFQCSTIAVGADVHQFVFPPLGTPAHAVAELAARYCTTDIQWHRMRATERQLVGLLHDIIGNPFRPVIADPAWLTPTVLAVASGVYKDRAFDRLPVLADALEDAGCENPDLLAHCRANGPHVRGCWAVDLVLGKG